MVKRVHALNSYRALMREAVHLRGTIADLEQALGGKAADLKTAEAQKSELAERVEFLEGEVQRVSAEKEAAMALQDAAERKLKVAQDELVLERKAAAEALKSAEASAVIREDAALARVREEAVLAYKASEDFSIDAVGESLKSLLMSIAQAVDRVVELRPDFPVNEVPLFCSALELKALKEAQLAEAAAPMAALSVPTMCVNSGGGAELAALPCSEVREGVVGGAPVGSLYEVDGGAAMPAPGGSVSRAGDDAEGPALMGLMEDVGRAGVVSVPLMASPGVRAGLSAARVSETGLARVPGSEAAVLSADGGVAVSMLDELAPFTALGDL